VQPMHVLIEWSSKRSLSLAPLRPDFQLPGAWSWRTWREHSSLTGRALRT
jgi:hypothetical protein